MTLDQLKYFTRMMYISLWQMAFPEKVAARNRRWRLRNRGKVRASACRYYARNKIKYIQWAKQNPLKRSEISARYYRNNKAKCARASSKWKSTNRHKVCASAAKRRAMLPLKSEKILPAIAKIYARCQELRRWFDVVVDHRIPLFRGGLHHAGNLQIIYAVENSRKGRRLDYTPSVIFA